MEMIFRDLKKQIWDDYGFTKKTIDFVPFEDWRSKLKKYSDEFPDEYSKNLNILRKKFGLLNLRQVKNNNLKLILFVGIPGAGKTTLAKILEKSLPNTILLRGHDIVDELNLFGAKKKEYERRLKKRGLKNPDPWYISYVYQESLTKELLSKGYNVIFDDHIRTVKNRVGYRTLAKKCLSKIIFIQISAPFETYFEREEDEDGKLKFLANMILQSEDFTKDEMRKYDKIIGVDGTLKLDVLKKEILRKIKY